MVEMDSAVKASKISAISNLLLAIFKGIAGIAVGSTALIADSIHSLVDVFGSILVWIGIKIAEKPADKSHPYGHFKAESLAEMAVGAIIISSSILIIYEAVKELTNLLSPSFEYYALLVALFSAFFNEVLARYKISVGKATKSSALIAEGKHSRVDVLASFSVFLGFIFVKLGYWWADGVVAIVISVIIFQIGAKIMKNSIDVLMDRVDEELSLQISEIVKNIEGVEKVELIASRGTWRSKIIEVHFSVKPGTSSELIDLIQKDIERAIKSRFPEVVLVVPVVKFLREKLIIAIPSDVEGKKYTRDFNSQYYTIVELNEDLEILSKKVIENLHFGVEKRKGLLVAELLEKNKVDVVIAGKIGEGGKAHLRSKGIKIVEADGNTVDEILSRLKDLIILH